MGELLCYSIALHSLVDDMNFNMEGGMEGMLGQLFDSPMVSQVAFQPTTFAQGTGLGANQTDGSIEVADGISLAYRLYHGAAAPKFVVLYFHANAETCVDIGGMISKYYDMNCAVMACSFRGFAWSTGSPSLTKLVPDCEKILDAAPAILEKAGLGGLPILSYGRSMGASCAVHVAVYKPDLVRAVVLDSGLQTLKDLPMIAPLTQMMGGAAAGMLAMVPEPIGTLDKMARLTQPVLLIHGTKDEIIPYAHAQKAFASCGSDWKKLQTVNGGGHNDIHQHTGSSYWEWFQELLSATGPAPPAAAPLTADEVAGLSVKELKNAMKQRGIDFSKCVEKCEMQALLLASLPTEAAAGDAAPAEAASDSHNGMVP